MTLHKSGIGDFTLIANSFLDNYMISANGEFVKIYLYLLRCSSTDSELSLSSIADTFNYTESDVQRALRYWEKCGLLALVCSRDGVPTDIILTENTAAALPEQRNRIHTYASRISDLPEYAPCQISVSPERKKELSAQADIRQLIYIAEQYLGKSLSSTEVTNILYFYDELHFSADLIEYLIEYCVSRGKKSIHYIRKVALEWAQREISTVKEARADTNLYSKDYYAVLKAFGIKDRGPAQAEADFMARWFKQFGFSADIVLEACRRTINRTHTPNFQYADKILEKWKAAGVKHFCDIAAYEKKTEKTAAAAPKPSRNIVSTNRFNNFPQRSYDYDKLEQQLLDS